MITQLFYTSAPVNHLESNVSREPGHALKLAFIMLWTSQFLVLLSFPGRSQCDSGVLKFYRYSYFIFRFVENLETELIL